ncbi:MAG: hypothetical protein R2880_05485 [Deinococcales bacterium]
MTKRELLLPDIALRILKQYQKNAISKAAIDGVDGADLIINNDDLENPSMVYAKR